MAEETTPPTEQAEAKAPPEPQDQAKAEEKEKLHLQVQVEATGPCSRLLKIEVAQEDVHKHVEDSYTELRKTIFIKGFRPGHIPRHILERRFGEEVVKSVKDALITDSLQDAIKEQGLNVAVPPAVRPNLAVINKEKCTGSEKCVPACPDKAISMVEKRAQVDDAKCTECGKCFTVCPSGAISPKIPLDPQKPLAFEVTIEVIPEFTIDNYKGVKVERLPVQVAPEDIARALESYRMRHGQYQAVEEGEVRETDIPLCHAAALQQGQELWRQDELGASLAANALGGIVLPGLKDALLGAKAGETRSLTCALPDTFPVEAHRGKPATLEITIDQIRRFEVPEATDAWAQSLKFDSLDDLREELKDEVHRQKQQDADRAVEDQIASRLLELTSFDVPDSLVDRVAEDSKSRIRAQLLYAGVPEPQIDKVVEERAASARDSAARACKLHFIYRKIADQEKLFVTEDELDQRLQAIALNYRRRPEDVRADLEQRGQLDALRRQMRDERVRDFLAQHAEITEAGAPAAAATDAPAAAEPPAQ